MRYELGDRLVGTVTFDPNAPDVPVDPPVKVDHRAKFLAYDKKTGDVSFDVPASDPALENPLAEIVVVFVPETFNGASTATDFINLPDDTCPKTRVTLTPEQFGAPLTLPRPAGMLPEMPYLGQAIHGYAN